MTQPSTNITSPVQPSYPTVWYCDPGDIQRRLSTANVKLHIEDFGKSSMSGESDAVSDCIWDATEIINYYCQVLYRPEDLVKSTWINRRATDIAVYILVSRRGNIQSGSLAEAYKQTIMWLEAIHSSRYEVPGIPIRATQAPVWSNVRIDQRYSTYRVRVERTISQRSPARHSQSVDWSSEYDYTV